MAASRRMRGNGDLFGEFRFCFGMAELVTLFLLLFLTSSQLFPYREVNGKAKHEPNASRKERPQKRGGGGRFEPYGNVNKRYRVFVSNIPYDVKWQALKDLMKDKGKVSISA